MREKSQPRLKISESNKLGKPQNRSNSINPIKKANTLTKLPRREADENIYALAGNELGGGYYKSLSKDIEDIELDHEINRRLNIKGNIK
jgi:hypothetical protein